MDRLSRNGRRIAAWDDGRSGEAEMSSGTERFELRGINHLALVCRDMAVTVDFYTNVLGMPLVKTIELPAGMGQHFFFDCGGGDCLAFFWFPNAPDGVPGISAPADRPDKGDLTSAIGSMNHVAFDVAPEKIEEYRERLIAAGIDCTEIANHDDSEWGISDEMHEGVFVRSIYFMDPDGILLEFACWMRDFEPSDVTHVPARAVSRAAAAAPGPGADPDRRDAPDDSAASTRLDSNGNVRRIGLSDPVSPSPV
jgi:catechol 2,3-dioxygenase-like lactoylglutathione lyase family enzyme